MSTIYDYDYDYNGFDHGDDHDTEYSDIANPGVRWIS